VQVDTPRFITGTRPAGNLVGNATALQRSCVREDVDALFELGRGIYPSAKSGASGWDPLAIESALRTPAWSDLGRVEDSKRWPLHAKNVGAIDLDEVDKLAADCPADKKLFWQEAKKWLIDEDKYVNVRREQPFVKSKLPIRDMEMMLRLNKIRELPFDFGFAKGSLRLFTVDEVAKKRRRPIFHPVDVNNALGKKDLQTLRNHPKEALRQAVLKGEYSITLDFSSYFDAFKLSENIAKYFVFPHQDRYYQLLNLAMGARPSVEVAQGCTWVLTGFEMPSGVICQTLTDNVRFVGSKGGVIEAALIFLRRCHRVNVTVNDISTTPTNEELEALVHQEGEFLGECYDYVTKTVRSTRKTVEKTVYSWNKRTQWTNRRFVAHLGLLFYEASTLRVKLTPYFDIFQVYRHLSADLATGVCNWDEKMQPLSAIALSQLEHWTQTMVENTPALIPQRQPRCTNFIVVDGSIHGWGAIYVSTDNHGEVQDTKVYSGKWPECYKPTIFRHSARAEPIAVAMAVDAVMADNVVDGSVTVFSDHQALKYIKQREYSRSFYVNSVLLYLQKEYPRTSFTFKFVPGEQNLADPFSRGVSLYDPQVMKLRLLQTHGEHFGGHWGEEREKGNRDGTRETQ